MVPGAEVRVKGRQLAKTMDRIEPGKAELATVEPLMDIFRFVCRDDLSHKSLPILPAWIRAVVPLWKEMLLERDFEITLIGYEAGEAEKEAQSTPPQLLLEAPWRRYTGTILTVRWTRQIALPHTGIKQIMRHGLDEESPIIQPQEM